MHAQKLRRLQVRQRELPIRHGPRCIPNPVAIAIRVRVTVTPCGRTLHRTSVTVRSEWWRCASARGVRRRSRDGGDSISKIPPWTLLNQPSSVSTGLLDGPKNGPQLLWEQPKTLDLSHLSHKINKALDEGFAEHPEGRIVPPSLILDAHTCESHLQGFANILALLASINESCPQLMNSSRLAVFRSLNATTEMFFRQGHCSQGSLVGSCQSHEDVAEQGLLLTLRHSSRRIDASKVGS